MLTRSTSSSSSLQASSENQPSATHLRRDESLQNLHRPNRGKPSKALLVDNNQLNLPLVVHRGKESIDTMRSDSLPDDGKTDEREVNELRRTIVQEDMENIQERLNEMLIAVPSGNENEKPALIQRKSTTEYFTPKVCIDGNHLDTDDDDDDDDPFGTVAIFALSLSLCHIHVVGKATGTVCESHPFFDALSSTTYEKEVMKYLLSLESRFMTENDKLRSDKRLRESSNRLRSAPALSNADNSSLVSITPKVRCKLIDWMISVHDYHRLNAGKRIVFPR